MEQKKILIGQKIKQNHKNYNHTQKKFWEKIGIEPSSLSNIENGKSFPSMQTVLRIMEEFGILPDNFFDYEYLKPDEELEKEMIEIIKRQSFESKRKLYRIMKQNSYWESD